MEEIKIIYFKWEYVFFLEIRKVKLYFFVKIYCYVCDRLRFRLIVKDF